MLKKSRLIYCLFVLILICNIFILIKYKNNSDHITDLIKTRDFMRYECKNRVRIGGFKDYIKNTNDVLWRIDGAWFICLDKNFELVKKRCNVLSFGINTDYSFDMEMQNKYNCRVDSFDPFIEADIFRKRINAYLALANAKTLPINENWSFHRIGIVGAIERVKDTNSIGSMLLLEDILEYTK